MRRSTKPRRLDSRTKLYRQSLAVLAVAATPLMWNHIADAAAKTYVNAGNSDWNTMGNWSPSGVPAAGDTVSIVNSNGVSHTVIYDFPGTVTLGTGSGTALFVDLTGGTGSVTNTLSMSTNTLICNGAEVIGSSGSGTLNQTGGTNTILGNALFVGGNSGSSGSYTLGTSGGASATLSVGANEAIGFTGTGSFTQNSGTNQLTGATSTFYVGFTASTGVGTYTLNGGNLINNQGDSSSVAEYVGFNGTGTFTQTGGSNTTGTGTSSKNLVVGEASTAFGSYTMNANTAAPILTVNGNEIIGDNAIGTTVSGTVTRYGGAFTQSAGTHTVTGNLTLGNAQSATGSYALSGSGSLAVTGTMNVGFLGVGTVTLNGGALSVGGNEVLGASAGVSGIFQDPFASTGNVAQVGGTVTVSGALILGDASSGHSGDNSFANGVYTISSGPGASSLGANSVTIGANGATGSFTQNTGTTVNVTTNLSISGQIFSANIGSSYTMTGGQLTVGGSLALNNFESSMSISNGTLSVTGAETLAGQFTQTGGLHTVGTSSVPSSLTIDNNTGATFTLNNLSGNTSSLTVHGDEFIGNSGSGSFSQASGTHTMTGQFSLGVNSGSSGSYTLSGTGVLNVDTTGSSGSGEYVGYSGTGNFAQTGGTNTVGSSSSPQPLVIGKAANAVGTYTMDNSTGTSILTVYGNEYVGGNSLSNTDEPSGTFIQNAGAHTVFGTLYVGFEAGILPQSQSGQGTFNLNNGTLQASAETIGFDYPAVFTQSAGTTNTDTGGLQIGGGGGYSSTYTLSGGTLLVGASSNPSNAFTTPEIIGVSATGAFVQTGGTHTVGTTSIGQFFIVGQTGTGTYTMSNPTGNPILTVNGPETIGVMGTGTFNQSAGTHSVTGQFLIADGTGSGSYTLSAGQLNVSTASAANSGGEFVGVIGTGTFVQTGGTHIIGTTSIPQGLEIGASASALGSYTMSNSASILTVNGSELVGLKSPGISSGGVITQYGGSFNQAGGTHAITGELDVGNFVGVLAPVPTGSFSISGGSLNVGGNILIGSSGGNTGIGVLNISGSATVSTTGTLTVGTTSGTLASLSGGALSIGGLANPAGSSHFNWTGGILTFTSNATVDSNSLGPITITSAMTLATTATLTNNTSITLNNGNIGGTGSFINNALLTGFGTLGNTGTFTNNAELLQSGGTLTLSSPGNNSNTGNIDLSPGLNFAVPTVINGLTNTGTINVNGAIISGAGLITNASGGTIAGRGTINVNLTNAIGATIIAQGGTLNIVGLPGFSRGAIEVVPGATLAGQSFSNFGSIAGAGVINNEIFNGGTISAVGGILTLNGPLTGNSGTITAATGNELVSTGFALAGSGDDGTIALAGGTIVFPSLLNQSDGNITGYGVLTTTGLENKGTMLLAGGSVTINGTLTNDSGATVKVQNASALFTSQVTNTGTFTIVSGGSATFAVGGTGIPAALFNAGNFSESSALISTGNFTNSGTASIGGTQTWSTGTSYTNTAGTTTFSTDTGSTTSSPLTITDTAGSITFSSTQHLANLSIASGASATASVSSPRNVLVTGALSVAGSLNLTNNDLIVHNGSLSAITGEITASHGSGNTWWTGTTGITSSSAASTPSTTALGVELNSDGSTANGGLGNPLLTSFDGQSVTETDVLVKYTFTGDADLSGNINAADYVLIDNGFNTQTGPNHLTGWRNGDFNYDGNINGDDYTLIDNAFNTQGSTSFAATSAGPSSGEVSRTAEMIATDTAQIAAVPEPTSLILLAAPLMAIRRRRKVFP